MCVCVVIITECLAGLWANLNYLTYSGSVCGPGCPTVTIQSRFYRSHWDWEDDTRWWYDGLQQNLRNKFWHLLAVEHVGGWAVSVEHGVWGAVSLAACTDTECCPQHGDLARHHTSRRHEGWSCVMIVYFQVISRQFSYRPVYQAWA